MPLYSPPIETDPVAGAALTSHTANVTDAHDVANRLNAQRLDQFTAPLAAVPLNGQRITGLADPSSAQDGATKNYVDVAIVGISWKPSVRLASSVNVVAGAASLVVDGVTTINGNRVLLMGQTIGSQNGIYVVGGVGSAVTLTRATDMDVGTEALSAAVPVEEGTANADKVFLQITNAPITLGTTSLVFTQLSGGGVTYTAGSGITISGNAIALATPIDAPQMTGAARITNTSSSHGLQILQQTTGDSSSEALDIVSDNEQDTTLGIRGVEAGRGTIKVTHDKPPSAADDANASVLSLRTNGSGTKAQLIFSDSDFGSTGKLFNLRQAGVDKFVVDANGTFVTASMPSSLVTFTPTGTIAATNVQAAIAEVASEAVPADSSTTVKGVAKVSVAPATSTSPIAVGDNDPRVVADQAVGTASIRTLGTGAQQAAVGSHTHAATAITNTPAGGIAASTVQAAINELDTEKATLASPTFTGTVTVPTPTAGDNTTKAASTAFARALAVSNVAGGTLTAASSTLDLAGRAQTLYTASLNVGTHALTVTNPITGALLVLEITQQIGSGDLTLNGSYLPMDPTTGSLSTMLLYFNGTDWVMLGEAPQWGPGDGKLKAWTFDPVAAGATQQPGAGIMYFSRIKIPLGASVTTVKWFISTAGATVANAFWGLYDFGGVRLGVTADMGTQMATGPNVTASGTMTADATGSLSNLNLGDYVLGLVVGSATTQPTLRVGATAGNIGLTLGTDVLRSFSKGTGNTSLPTSVSLLTSTGGTVGAFAPFAAGLV
jgi:hypothetical protein